MAPRCWRWPAQARITLVPEVCGAIIREVDQVAPRNSSYESRYQTYRDLYPALKPLFPRM